MSQKKGHTVTHTKFGHTLTATLYGEVTEKRIAAAKAELAHRAEQLYTTDKPAAPVYASRSNSYGKKSYEEDWTDSDEWFDEDDE